MTTAETLPVVFRVFRGETVAVFPTVQAVRGSILVLAYAHTVQHCQADPEILMPGRGRRAAKPEEYAELLRELRGIYENSIDPVPLEVFAKAEGRAAPFFKTAA